MKGFTLLELIVVFAILAIVGTVSMVGFSQFNSKQQFNSTVLDVTTVIQKAKSRAQTQAKPDTVLACRTVALSGYEVHFCGFAGSQCSGSGTGRYELHIRCGSNSVMLEGTQLPTGIQFDNGTSGNIFFRVLNGSATPGTVNLRYGTATKTIQVSGVGNITTQ